MRVDLDQTNIEKQKPMFTLPQAAIEFSCPKNLASEISDSKQIEPEEIDVGHLSKDSTTAKTSVNSLRKRKRQRKVNFTKRNALEYIRA